MLRTISLRNKLLLAVGLPMILLVVGAIFLFNAAQADVQTETNEDALVQQDLRYLLLAEGIQVEQTAGLLGSSSELTNARQATDQLLQAAIGGATGSRSSVESIQTQLDQVRGELGSDAEAIQRQTTNEYAGARVAATPTLDQNRQLSELATEATSLVQVNSEVYEAGITVVHLTELVELTEWQNEIAKERGIIQLILADGVIGDKGQIALLESAVATESARETALQSAHFQAELAPALREPALDELNRLRSALRDSGGGTFQSFDAQEVTAGSEVLTNAIRTARSERIESINQIHEIELRDAKAARANIVLAIVLIGLCSAALLYALYRAISDPIRTLSKRGREIASKELPELVDKVRTGEADSEIQVEPLVAETDDEVGELVDSFNELRTTALELASAQAQSRKTASEMFVNLGHRNQRILESVLEDLDNLEQNEQDPDRLSKLYLVDQKVTRMRRNAESLLVLAGTHTPRMWAESAPLGDVVRAAMSEVENFERVESSVFADVAVPGKAVADLTHLMAELIENALRFSPAEKPVTVKASQADGLTKLYITDEGFGMSGDKLTDANQRITDAADQEEVPSKNLGLFVVGRLAARHGITVELSERLTSTGLEVTVDLAGLEAPAPKRSTDGDAKMPEIAPAVPPSSEVKTFVENNREGVGHIGTETATAKTKTADNKPSRRVPGSHFSEPTGRSTDTSTVEPTPTSAAEVRDAFSGFQRSAGSTKQQTSSKAKGGKRSAALAAAAAVTPTPTTAEPEDSKTSKLRKKKKKKKDEKSLSGGIAAALLAANKLAPDAEATRAAAQAAAFSKREAEDELLPPKREVAKVQSRTVQRRVPGANLPSSKQAATDKPASGDQDISAPKQTASGPLEDLPSQIARRTPGTNMAKSLRVDRKLAAKNVHAETTLKTTSADDSTEGDAPKPRVVPEPKTERRGKATSGRQSKRRVPGANMPTSVVSPSNTSEKPTAKASSAESIRDAFSGFQNSAKPATSVKSSSEKTDNAKRESDHS